jgi:uncharacterized membrane protein
VLDAFAIISFTLLLLGTLLRIKPIRKINPLFGYRTSQSMANQASWDFANKNFSIKVQIIGATSLLLSAILTACSFFQVEIDYQLIALILIIVQSVLVIVAIILVERSLRRRSTNTDSHKKE